VVYIAFNKITKFFFGTKYSTNNIEVILYLGVIITVVHFYQFTDYPLLALFLLSTIPLSIIFHRLNNRYFKYQHPVSAEFHKFALLYSGGVILQLLAAAVISLFYTKPYTSFYAHALSKFHYADQLGFLPMLSTFLIGWLLLAIGNFLNNTRKYFIQLRQQERELVISKQKELQSQAELDALQARVNPHFLYNSLNSIAGLAQEDPAKTEDMAIALSHFFKYSTNRQKFKSSCLDELMEIKMPRFLLQPLVENAIKYGYDKATNNIAIELVIRQQNEQLQFQLFDGGTPFPDNMPSGYGLQSIRKKLALLYPEKHELAFINEPKKHVLITLIQTEV